MEPLNNKSLRKTQALAQPQPQPQPFSMSNSIIEVNNLSKSYTISHEPVPMQSGGRERYTSLRDVMAQKAKKILDSLTLILIPTL